MVSISPRLRVHSDGEKVHAMDPVVLYHVGTGLLLHVESGQLPDGKREVSGTIDFSAFKVMIYRNYLEERASKEEKVCLGGAQVRMVHKEAEGLIGCDMRRARLGMPVYVAQDDAKVRAAPPRRPSARPPARRPARPPARR